MEEKGLKMVKSLTKDIDTYAHDEIITIALDNCAEHFSVSKALLCSASDYFRKALNGRFKESSERVLRLPGCTEETWHLLLYYMVEGSIPDLEDEIPLIEALDPHSPLSGSIQTTLVRLWFAADAYLIPKLQNLTMDRLLMFLGGFNVKPELVEHVFKEGGEDCPLRDVYVREIVSDMYSFSEDEHCQLGSVPGFFSSFAKQLTYCPGRENCHHEPHCTPSLRSSFEQFHVKVD